MHAHAFVDQTCYFCLGTFETQSQDRRYTVLLKALMHTEHVFIMNSIIVSCQVQGGQVAPGREARR